MLAAYDFYQEKPRQVVIAGDSKAADTAEMVRALHSLYLPNTLFILADDTTRRILAEKMPVINSLTRVNGKATAYICENFSCSLPTTDVAEMVARLQKSSRN